MSHETSETPQIMLTDWRMVKGSSWNRGVQSARIGSSITVGQLVNVNEK
jgi:hypothetical protein